LTKTVDVGYLLFTKIQKKQCEIAACGQAWGIACRPPRNREDAAFPFFGPVEPSPNAWRLVMRRFSFSLSLIAVLLFCLPTVAGAQEEEKQTSFVYATYFECNDGKQWRVDEITKSVYAPVYDAAVEEGTISSWGWLAHHTGGKWNRLFYFSAPNLGALMDADDAVAPKVKEANPYADREFGEICGAHEDYIWEAGIGSRGAGLIPEERGKVGISVYFYCDMSKEERADEIVEETFAPIYNEHVAAGNLVSWGWMEHWVGGKYRRLSTMTATDMSKLTSARDAIIEALIAKEDAMQRFGEICNGHTDYIWNIRHETP